MQTDEVIQEIWFKNTSLFQMQKLRIFKLFPAKSRGQIALNHPSMTRVFTFNSETIISIYGNSFLMKTVTKFANFGPMSGRHDSMQ